MVFVLRSFSAKPLLVLGTITSFVTASITPVHAVQVKSHNAGVVDLAVQGVRVKKLIDKMHKYKDSNNLDKLIECMLDIKSEAELSTGKAISLDSMLNKVQEDIKQKGHKINKDQFNAIKKMFKKKEAKHNHKVMFMAECIEMGIMYDSDLEQAVFKAKHKDDKPEIVLSLQLAIGVTCCCVGGFLMFIPIPMSLTVGEAVCMFGASLIMEELVLQPALEQDKKNR